MIVKGMHFLARDTNYAAALSSCCVAVRLFVRQLRHRGNCYFGFRRTASAGWCRSSLAESGLYRRVLDVPNFIVGTRLPEEGRWSKFGLWACRDKLQMAFFSSLTRKVLEVWVAISGAYIGF